MIGATSGENYLRARPKLKIFDGHEVGSDAATDAWLSDDRLWLQKVEASEREPVAFQLKDGSWMQISTHPIHGGGRVYLRTDITKLKRIEESLREHERLFRTLAETTPHPLWFRASHTCFATYHIHP